jgi:hypothetical protein
MVSTQAIILGSIKRRNGLDQSSAGKLFERLLVITAPLQWLDSEASAAAQLDSALHDAKTPVRRSHFLHRLTHFWTLFDSRVSLTCGYTAGLYRELEQPADAARAGND